MGSGSAVEARFAAEGIRHGEQAGLDLALPLILHRDRTRRWTQPA